MSHLHIIEQTPDRLVLRRVMNTRDRIVIAIVGVTTLGFVGWTLLLATQSMDPWLLGAGSLFALVMVRMALLPNRVRLDRASDRLSVTQPMSWRWSKLSRHRLTVEVRQVAAGHIAVLKLGLVELAVTPPQPNAPQAKAMLAEDAAVVGTYLAGGTGSQLD